MIGSPLETIPRNQLAPSGYTLKVDKFLPFASGVESQGPIATQETPTQEGGGPIDWVISNLPGEMHITDMGDDGKVQKAHYCGPGTDLEKRLARGDPGINELDREGCKPHDIWYRDHPNAKERHIDDKRLAKVADRIAADKSKPAMQRRKAKLVSAVMKGKVFLGLGSTMASISGGSIMTDIATKAISYGLDKFIDFSIKRKNKKNKKNNKEKQEISQPAAPSSDPNATWNGTAVKLYKKNGTKKTRKELEDELYSGIIPSEGSGRRRR